MKHFIFGILTSLTCFLVFNYGSEAYNRLEGETKVYRQAGLKSINPNGLGFQAIDPTTKLMVNKTFNVKPKIYQDVDIQNAYASWKENNLSTFDLEYHVAADMVRDVKSTNVDQDTFAIFLILTLGMVTGIAFSKFFLK